MNTYISDQYKDLQSVAKLHSNAYEQGKPFPNIHFDNFFSPEFLDKVLDEFPDLSKKEALRFDDSKHIKLAGRGEKFFGVNTMMLMHYLNSEPFLIFLQELTGIKETLVGDPYYIGGGQHEIKKNGLLKIHSDFNKHPRLHLDRRINVLIYLNKDWKEEYGGHFELWDSKMEKCVKRILPLYNTMAIFSTTDFSYHGHPNPLTCPEDRSRKSLALYYYTNGRPQNEVGGSLDGGKTYFKQRKNNEQDKKAFQQTTRSAIKSIIKEIAPPFISKMVKRLKN